MQFHQPRELIIDGKPSGLWHYTTRIESLKRTMPEGYCANDCPGHSTKEGAYEHYREYLLDHASFTVKWGDWRECQVCGILTKHGAQTYGMHYAYLCDEHCNREGFAQVLTVGDSFGDS